MLNEPHYPSKWTVATVFIVILLLMGGVFAWAFYFNLGTIVFQSDQAFSLQINEEFYDCDEKQCDVTLPPGVYEVLAQREGHYEQRFSARFERLTTLEESLEFELIPFIKQDQVTQLPDEDEQLFVFNRSGEDYQLRNAAEQTLTSFESLKDPTLRVAEERALVIDSGRLFFVDLDSGRKERRFDDQVEVTDALLSDDASRSLLFVNAQGRDQLWVYYHEDDQLTPLIWFAEPGLVQWEAGSSHRLYAITDQLQETQQPSLFADLLQASELVATQMSLFQINLDTAEVRLLQAFDQDRVPLALHRRGQQYYLEYEEELIEELVIQ